jgi:hypothetical protein
MLESHGLVMGVLGIQEWGMGECDWEGARWKEEGAFILSIRWPIRCSAGYWTFVTR